MALLRQLLQGAFGRAIRIYFREVEVAGNAPSKDTGGRVFVANHVNALVDPILVLTTAPCPISPVAKSTLWKIPGLRWLLDLVDAVPIVRRRDDASKAAGDNDAVFDRVATWLEGGGNILLFPEGTSHNEPHLIEVKSGAGRMLARAFERGGREVTYQAVALEFDARDVFRSRCLMLYGPIRAVADEEARGDALVSAITARLRDDLSELLVEGATWSERLLIARVAEMLAHDAGERTLEGWSTFGRQVEAARKALGNGDEATVAGVAAAVDRYYALLEEAGVGDDQVTAGADPRARGRAGRAAVLLLLLPLALAGIALYALPYRLPRLASRLARGTADEISTYKLGAGLVVYPLWAAVLTTVAVLWLPASAAAPAVAVILASPFAALAWLDRAPRLRRLLRSASGGARRGELARARAEAMERIGRVRVQLGL